MNNTKGLLLATAAAALFIASPAWAEEHPTGTEAKVHCGGVNACKGTSECKTASHGCKGQNSCAGQGWVALSKEECEAKGGKVVE